MTPIYDDYQTAVAMIRSGTPGLPSPATPPALEATVPRPDGDLVDLPKTPGWRISYSMTDVHRKLAENVNELQSASPRKEPGLKQSATTYLPSEAEGGRRVSIPVFPLPGRDSDEENERLVNRVEYASEDTGDNPADIDLEDNSIPLRNMGLAQVRTRTRGEPVHSQEIHASSADFEFADDLNSDIPGTTAPASSSARVSDNAPTDTSTIGQIVDQYGSAPGEEMDASFGSHSAVPFEISFPRGFGLPEEQAPPVPVHRPGSRSAADAGPPPSWPLPQPPVLLGRSSKRRNSSGMLSSPETYGNTSGLLNTKLVDASPLKTTCPGLVTPDLSPADPSQLKQSRSSTDLASARDFDFDTSGRYGESGLAVTRLSHVSEESSGHPSGGSGWMPAEVFAQKPLENNECKGSAFRLVEASRRVDDVAYPSEVFKRGARHHHGKKFGAGARFGSLDQVLAGKADTDSDTIDVVDDADWETIHESGSTSNLQPVDIHKTDLPMSERAESPTADNLSLGKTPVSSWDPLSNKAPGLERPEKKMEELLKSHKKSTQNEQVEEMADTVANKSKVPNLGAQAKQPISLPGHINVGRRAPQGSILPPPKVSQANTPKTAAHLYTHPTPLQTKHKHPFTAARPILHPVTKTQSASSTDTMADQIFNLRNRNIESTSSLAGGSAATVSVASGDDRHRAIQREIDLYDPGKYYTSIPERFLLLTLLQTAHESARRSQTLASQLTSVSAREDSILKSCGSSESSAGGSLCALRLHTSLAALF
jgi:hypothetical protein